MDNCLKVVEDGNVAVIVTDPDLRGPWAGFAPTDETVSTMLFHPELVDVILRYERDELDAEAGTELLRQRLATLLGCEAKVEHDITGLSIWWVAEGQELNVTVVDGAEYILFTNEIVRVTA